MSSRLLLNELSNVAAGNYVDVAVNDTRAYCTRTDLIHIYDITDPENLIYAGAFTFDTGVVAMAISDNGSYLFYAVAGGIGKVRRDLVLGTRKSGGYTGIDYTAVKDQYLYHSGTIEVYSGSPMGVMSFVGAYDSYLYLYYERTSDLGYTVKNDKWRIWDFSNPSLPSTVSDQPTDSYLTNKCSPTESGDYVVCATSTGLVVYDVTTPAAPVEINNVPVAYPLTDIVRLQDDFFVALSTSGDMILYDIQDPSNIHNIETKNKRTNSKNNKWKNGYLYLAGTDGLTIYELYAPAPVTIDKFTHEGNVAQGDVLAFQTLDDGDIEVKNGLVLMSGGLQTAVYLSIFGGNEDLSTWWGDVNELDPVKKYVSKTQNLLQALPANANNLRRIEEAATADLGWMTTSGAASVVVVFASIPGLNQLQLDITITAQGSEQSFVFSENWKAKT